MVEGEAPEIDQIIVELLKADTESTCMELKRLLVPEQWKQGLICKILKKGNLQKCGSWRGGGAGKDSDQQNTRR